MKIYISKFALKQGIVEADAEVDAQGRAHVTGAFPWLKQTFSKTDYSHDKGEAQKRARAMAIAKANKLEREAADLRAMSFGAEED